ncbi:C-C chemokine receptor type 4-like [Lepisosteus oculatus]|uniref:C-C chemokine receptor type 4-like n=1 Tax=Lepisosteus oculatus TaxID=7918 RepID=UPI0035F50CC2
MTETESYEDYYDLDNSTSPCTNDNIKSFSPWFIPTLYTLVFITGLIGNGLVVCVLIKFKKLKSMTDVYLLNLAISDLIFVFSLPFWSHYAANNNWAFGEFMCKTITGFYLIGFYSGIFFIMILSIDRYLAIVCAISATKLRSVTYGLLMSVVTWAISVFASVPTLVFSQVKNESTGFTCKTEFSENEKTKWQLVINFEINILGLLIPLCVIFFCYLRILQILKKCRNCKKEKAIRLIFTVVTVFVLFWTPYNIVIFLKSLEVGGYINDYIDKCLLSIHIDFALHCTETLAFVHCCLNPVIYAFAGQEFRKLVKKRMFPWWNCIICKECKTHRFEWSETGNTTYKKSSGESYI